MKKIYVYVGQLRDWMLRMAQRVKGLLGVRVMNKEVIAEVATCSLDSEETTRSACNSHPVAPYSLYEQRESSPNETLLVRAERFLWERYEFRYNVLAKGYEYREASPIPSQGGELGLVMAESPLLGRGRGEAFRLLDDEQRRYLLMQLQHAGINVPYVSHIQAIVDCGRQCASTP